MHDVVFQPFNLDRAKCAQSYVKQQINPSDLRGGETIEERFGKVKSSRRGSNRAGTPGIDGLVSLSDHWMILAHA